MMVRVLLITCCLFIVAPATFAQPATGQATQPADHEVGRVLGKVVTTRDVSLDPSIDYAVDFDARDAERWAAMTRVSQAFIQPLVLRFIEAKKIEATEDELKEFDALMQAGNAKAFARLQKQLADDQAKLKDESLPAAERDRLNASVKSKQSLVDMLGKDESRLKRNDALARQFIVGWKTQRELHRTYGGRVIFQQAGAEALDGMRRLLEEAEASGDLKIVDAEVRSLLYHYYDMKHTVVDAKTIETSPFMRK